MDDYQIRFEKEFREIIVEESEFLKEWDNEILWTPISTSPPYIVGLSLLSLKGKDRYNILINKLKGRKL